MFVVVCWYPTDTQDTTYLKLLQTTDRCSGVDLTAGILKVARPRLSWTPSNFNCNPAAQMSCVPIANFADFMHGPPKLPLRVKCTKHLAHVLLQR